MTTVSQVSHNSLKELGNKHFACAQYEKAIAYYSLAIHKKPSESCYFSNRALCYIQLHDYEKALQDCRRSLELNPLNLKAYFFAGEADLGLGNYDEALPKLMRAHNLALEQHINYGDEITGVIRLAKRKKFEVLDEKRRQEEIELQSYLIKLIRKDYEKRSQFLSDQSNTMEKIGIIEQVDSDGVSISSLKLETAPNNVSVSAQISYVRDSKENDLDSAEKLLLDNQDNEECTIQANDLNTKLSNNVKLNNDTFLQEEMQRKIAEVNDLFYQLDDRRKKREVPEHLCGRISAELMLDPVITPSGITYDRRSIQAHLRQVGHFDPITRQPLVEDQLIPNLAMKEVVHLYLEENPWAEHY